jgi:hypothetical protein
VYNDAGAAAGAAVYYNKASGYVGIGTLPTYHLDVNGTTRTKVLKITGGSDLSEQFQVRAVPGATVDEGMLVRIDSEIPGQLAITTEPYDRRVVGVISGAGGIRPGMLMAQTGTEADGEHAVALTGRVYCWADASTEPIEPGDLLTSSTVPGHAMKATDPRKAQGAIIGKAMSGLESGNGLVLMLVTLQ